MNKLILLFGASLFILGCKVNPSIPTNEGNQTQPDSNGNGPQPSEEVGFSNPQDIQLPTNPVLDNTQFPNFVWFQGPWGDTSWHDDKGGDKILNTDSGVASKTMAAGKEGSDNHDLIGYLYESNPAEEFPFEIYAMKYGDNEGDQERKNQKKSLLFKIQTNGPSGSLVPTEKLQMFKDKKAEQICIQLALKGKSFNIILAQGSTVSSNNSIPGSLYEYVQSEAGPFIEFFQSAKELYDKNPSNSAQIRFAWKGTNKNTGKPETVYSEIIKMDDAKRVKAVYNITKIFEKL